MAVCHTITLEIGGVSFQVAMPSQSWQQELDSLYRSFASTKTPDWHLRLRHDPELTFADQPWMNHEGQLSRFHIDCYAGWFDLATNRAEVGVPSLQLAPPGLERTIAWACMQDLPRQQQALLLHAAGILLRDHGLVISGHSGAGKTTVARLADGFAQVLNDEMVIVNLAGPQPLLLSTPFVGRKTPPELIRRARCQAPIRALLLLEHASDFELAPLSPAQAVVRLLETDIVAVERVVSTEAWLAIAEKLVSRVPAYRLRFPPTGELWPFLVDALDL